MTNLQISGIGPKDFVGRTGSAQAATTSAPFAGVSDGYAGEVDKPSIYKFAPVAKETSSGRGYIVRNDVASHVLAAMGVPAVVAAHTQAC